jgi:hypothetical protein
MKRHGFLNMFIGLMMSSLLFTSTGFTLAQTQTLPAPANEYEAFEGFKSIAKIDSPTVKGVAENMFERIQPQAKTGDARSQYYMGRMYAEGIGVNKDNQLATYWFQKAAEQGSADSQFRLAFQLKDVDNRAANFWLKESAGQGWAFAQYGLGMAYSEGTLGMGITKDVQLAYFWLLLASSDGNKAAIFARDYVGDKMLNQDQRIAIQANVRNWRPKAAAPTKYSVTSESNPNAKSGTAQADSTGSGFRVARGLVVTNHHVIDGCSRLQVNGVQAVMKNSDQRSDIALLSSAVGGSVVNLRAQRVAVGESVAVAGYPLRGLLSGFNMTTGSLSSLSGLGGDTRLLQITAPVQPGNSGGPVLDSAGNLMGVVVSKLDALKAAKITGDIPQNVNFAINSNVLRAFLDASGVEYDVANSGKAIAPTAIAEKAKDFTVLVECWK